ncbi:ABC transporter permease [Variovorax sp. CCNWLW235]|uniref:ABC transporter permease n=1 Tax=Variovorax sp. CCNWLW235 TaxID=3127463 RepID=UPI003077DE0C
MSWLAHELRLLVRSKLALAALALLLVLSTLAVLSGTREVARQQQTIARLAGLQQQDLAAQARKYTHGGDAGSAAYYTFHGTWDAPSSTAFLALGLRDATPYVLRVRALALQAQLHEGENFNPELALAGRFDFAFVLVYLAPLFLVALLHDLVSGERRSGRLGTLLAMPGAGRGLWLRRAGLRTALVFSCLVLPVLAGALGSGTAIEAVGIVLLVTAGYLAVWSGLALIIATRRGSSAANAMALMGCWAVLTLILPTLANAVLVRAVPVHQGVELMLAQRQAVHGAWDLPPEATMEKFFRTHPEWRHTAPLPSGFHWKWYYAFQQLGDESAAPQVAAYRDGLIARQRWTSRLGWLLPGVGVQAALHRQADTDLQAQLAYQDRIAEFHARLRAFYYPYLFNDLRFGQQDFASQPHFSLPAQPAEVPLEHLLALLLMGVAVLALGVAAAGRVRPSAG